MINQPISQYIWFGLFWRFLQDAQTGFHIHGENLVLANISRVLEGLESLGLLVTLRAAKDLGELRDELQVMPAGSTLTAAQATNLQTLMNDLQRTLAAEAQGNFAYIVTDKRLDVRKLLARPQDLFAPDVFQNLPEVAKYDFAEAALCIAFERPTAAAFHLLRGTEDVLRTFYCTVVRRDRVDPLL